MASIDGIRNICNRREDLHRRKLSFDMLNLFRFVFVFVWMQTYIGWCPYFLARHMLAYANVIVYNYQYMLDPKVSGLVSRELERECIVVFDEAHNIDNVCIEALSVNLRRHTLDSAARSVAKLRNKVDEAKAKDAKR